MTTTQTPSAGIPRAVLWLARVLVALAFPIVSVLLAVRLLMTPAFLTLEYTRPGFPEDSYGMTTEERLRWAPYAVNYLTSGASLDMLADLRFDDGSALYNASELRHMRDVQLVTQVAFAAGLALALAAGVALLVLRRAGLAGSALRDGARLTLALIAAIIIGAVVNWNGFFTLFHELFFADGTWQFAWSDTLIRLFPEQFWFDAALAIGGFAAGTALLTLGVQMLSARRRR